MNLKADREEIVRAAAGWDGIGKELQFAHDLVAGGIGQGAYFGALATIAGIDRAHDTFIQSMTDALSQGVQRMQQIGDLLREVAKDFGETDLSVRDQFHNEDGTPA